MAARRESGSRRARGCAVNAEHPSVKRLLALVDALREALRHADERTRLQSERADYWCAKARKYGQHFDGCLGNPECTCGFTDPAMGSVSWSVR